MSNPKPVVIRPNPVVFYSVAEGSQHSTRMEFANQLSSTVQFTVKPTIDRGYQVKPNKIVLSPKASIEVELSLRVHTAIPKQKAGGFVKDAFQIKGDYFDQTFYVKLTNRN